MKKIQLMNKLKTVIALVEIIVSLVIIVGIAAGMISTLLQLPAMFYLTADRFYDEFSGFLGNVLLIVVGLELVRMLITHTTRATLELVIYVIARKLLIYTDTMTDMLLGTVALAIVFLTMRFILLKPGQQETIEMRSHFPGYIKIKDVNKALGLNIPMDGEKTLSDLVKQLSGPRSAPKVNQRFKAGPVSFVVKEMDPEGEISEIEITESTFDERDPYDH